MNVRSLWLIIVTAFISQTVFAGNSFLFKNLKLKKIGLHYGVEQDVLMGNVMSDKYFNSLAGHPNLNEALENRVDANYYKYSGTCENPHMRLSFAWELPKPNQELHLGLIGVFNRLDGMSYHKSAEYIEDYTYFNYDLNSNEFALEAEYVFNKELKLIKNIFHINLSGFGGTNFGYQYANRLKVSGTNAYETRELGEPLQRIYGENVSLAYIDEEQFANMYDVSNAINQRAYVGGGVGLIFFNRLELGIKGKFGYGYRYHFSNDFAGTNIRSFDLNAKWILK